MNHEPLQKQKIRIIEVDRKLAAHLADVWEDMKLRIEKSVESLKKPTKPSKLRNEIKDQES
jgi:gas vesicle protein